MSRSRAAAAAGLALTARDLAILAAVADHRFLTREQVQRLFFGPRSPFGAFRATGADPNGYRRACDRLKRLAEAGYLRRLVVPRPALGLDEDQPERPTAYAPAPYLYALARAGAELVAGERGCRPEALLVSKVTERRWWTIAHEVAVADVRIAFALSADGAEGWGLDTWLTAAETLDRYRVTSPAGEDRRCVFAPDGFAVLRTPAGRPLGVFVEVDRGTESLRTRIVEKLETYLDYATSGRFRERYAEHGLRSFRCAFVTTGGDQRVSGLCRTAAALAHGVFWVARRQLVVERNVLEDPIWWQAGDPCPAAIGSRQVELGAPRREPGCWSN